MGLKAIVVPGYPAPYPQNAVYSPSKRTKILSDFDMFSRVMLGYKENEVRQIEEIMRESKVELG